MPRAEAVDPIAALRHPGFTLFLTGSLLSSAGNQMRSVAVGWEVYERTGQALSLGIVGLVMAIPVLMFALPSGALADRYSRRALIIISRLALAACGLGLAWTSVVKAPMWVIYLLLFGTGTFRALGWPASTAIVASLVPTKTFPNAAMWRSVQFQIAGTVGPLAGGFLLAWQGPVFVYLLDAASGIFQVVCLVFIRPRTQSRTAEPHSWRHLLEGIAFLRRNPVIVSTMALDMVGVLFGGATALLPIYATDVLHVGAEGLGWLRAMPSLGAIAMGLTLAFLPPIKHGGMTLLWTVAVFGLATIVFGVSTWFPLSLFSLFVAGASDAISVVIRTTVLQLLTPDAMRGRVTAVSIIFIGTSNEIGEFESGVAAQWLGLVPSVVFGGLMTVVTVGAVAAIWPQLPRLGSLAHLEPPEPVEVVV